MSDLASLASEWASAHRRFIAFDPASPSCDSVGARDAMHDQRLVVLRMFEKSGHDMDAVRAAQAEARNDRQRDIVTRGYYTTRDVKAFRNEFGM